MFVTPVLAKRLKAGETLTCGWCALPEPLVAEGVARAGFDAVLLEIQHGLHDTASVMRFAYRATSKPNRRRAVPSLR